MFIFFNWIAINTFNIKDKNIKEQILIWYIPINKFKGYLSKPSTCPIKILKSKFKLGRKFVNLLTELWLLGIIKSAAVFPTLVLILAEAASRPVAPTVTAIFPPNFGHHAFWNSIWFRYFYFRHFYQFLEIDKLKSFIKHKLEYWLTVIFL